MQVIRGWKGLAARERGASVALGNFDGVHLGHQALIARAARAVPGAPHGVVTFEPHPRRYFRPDALPFRLTAPAEQARILAGLGIGRLHVLDFDAALAGMTAEAFAADVLADGLGLRHLVVGEDFRFGRGRQGDAALLRRLGGALGFGVSIEHLRGGTQGAHSSTAIRVMIEQGQMREAAAALGRWHTVSGTVIEGDRRGRELGYPTANLAFGEQLVPRFGVYAAQVQVHDGPHRGRHDGVASIGVRPTFGVNAPNFEVHLFDFSGDLYGAEVSVALVAWLRGELRFDGIAPLIARMDADSAEAREVLAHARLPDPP